MLHSIKGENSLYGISLNVEMKVLYNQKLNFKTQLWVIQGNYWLYNFNTGTLQKALKMLSTHPKFIIV
jgi:hypothetical protein